MCFNWKIHPFRKAFHFSNETSVFRLQNRDINVFLNLKLKMLNFKVKFYVYIFLIFSLILLIFNFNVDDIFDILLPFILFDDWLNFYKKLNLKKSKFKSIKLYCKIIIITY